jgi:DNA-binding LytR/AlgR family response regulator
MNFQKIRYLIVEDIFETAKELQEEIAKRNDAEFIDLANNVSTAFKLFNKKQYNILFLDINLKCSNGYDLLKKIKAYYPKLPYTIIITGEESGKDNFAKQFSDYVPYIIAYWHKPIFANIEDKLEDLILKLKNHPSQIPLTFLPIGKDERCKIDNIIYLEADKQYTKIYLHNASSTKIVSKNLKQYELLLPRIPHSSSEGFIRIHKSFIVNKAFVRKMPRNGKTGKCYFINTDDQVYIPISELLYTNVKKELGF